MRLPSRSLCDCVYTLVGIGKVQAWTDGKRFWLISNQRIPQKLFIGLLQCTTCCRDLIIPVLLVRPLGHVPTAILLRSNS